MTQQSLCKFCFITCFTSAIATTAVVRQAPLKKKRKDPIQSTPTRTKEKVKDTIKKRCTHAAYFLKSDLDTAITMTSTAFILVLPSSDLFRSWCFGCRVDSHGVGVVVKWCGAAVGGLVVDVVVNARRPQVHSPQSVISWSSSVFHAQIDPSPSNAAHDVNNRLL